MSARRRPRLAALLPAAVLAPAALVLAPGASVAQDALQSRWSQSVTTVVASALPVVVTASLTEVPSPARTTYALALPSGPVVVVVEPEPDEQQRTWSSSASFSLPSGTPCGSYSLTATLATGSTRAAAPSRTAPPTAGGTVDVVGCPAELEVAPLDDVRTAPVLPWSFRGRELPPAATGGRLLVDGVQVGPDLTSARFWTAAELELGCGNHDVRVVARTGEVLEGRTARLRCPSAAFEQDAVDRTALPREVPLDVRELASDTAFEVLLDGAVVVATTTDASGAARIGVPVPGRAACGQHDVTVRQALPPVTALPPYPDPAPPPEPDDPPDEPDDGGGGEEEPAPSPSPTSSPVPSPTFTSQPSPTSQPTATVAPPTSPGGPVVVLRAAAQDLPAAARTALVTVPLTVGCPQTPSLDVTPPVGADDRRPVAYRLRGDGFGDDAHVEVTAGPAAVLAARADGIGRLDTQVELRLPCGPTTFTARDADGRTARDAVEVRCPSLRLDPATLFSAELPRSVSAQAAGFDSGAELDVLLDGAQVTEARADDDGAAVVPLRAGATLACGAHDVVVRQSAADPVPQARATLTVTCPPPGTPVVDVSPEVVPDGHVVTVTGDGLPPGDLRLVWRLRDGTQRSALRQPVRADDGRLQLDLLVLRGEPAGPRRLLALGGGAVVADADDTLVVLDSVQPGRRADRGTVLLGRR